MRTPENMSTNISHEAVIPARMMLTRAYIPDQPYIGMFPLEEALRKGTIFPNLAVPYAIKQKE
jgi:hypothetical protein